MGILDPEKKAKRKRLGGKDTMGGLRMYKSSVRYENSFIVIPSK